MKLNVALLVILLVAQSLAGQFPTVTAERNLEKRSELALKEADRLLTAAKQAYQDNQLGNFRSRISEVAQLVDLSYKSLVDTGKSARRHPKYWKRTEQALRVLMRRLDSITTDVSIDDRDILIAAHKHLSHVHDRVIDAVMTQK